MHTCNNKTCFLNYCVNDSNLYSFLNSDFLVVTILKIVMIKKNKLFYFV